jgi:hypothetical protein
MLFKMSSVEKRATFSQVQLENGLHQAVALAAMTLLITAHRAIMNTGFTLRQSGLSTDAMISLIIGAITCTWTTLVIISGLLIGDEPCRTSFEQCTARLAYAPWLMQVLFIFWLFAWFDELLYLKSKDIISTLDDQTSEPESRTKRPQVTITAIDGDQPDPESRIKRSHPLGIKTALARFMGRRRWRIWKMECSHGPLNWSGSTDWKFRWGLYCTIGMIVFVVSYGAIKQKLYTVGLLGIVGLVLFIFGAAGANKYAAAPHIYTADTLRVMLHTRHREGTVYILPIKNRGFDAVWSPKIECEHRALDEAFERSMSSEEPRQERLGHLSSVLASFNSSTDLTAEEIQNLATWLYEPERSPNMRKIACTRASGLHLISYSLMYALWHAEYLVFMRSNELDPATKKMMGTLRNPRTTGLDLDRESRQIGSRRGLEGYQDAVRYIYRLFDEEVDEKAIRPTSKPPKASSILSPCPDTIEEYVARLWDYCFLKHESTFAALYAFTLQWVEDIGNDVANGWHGFPLRARDRDGDIVSWHIIWRQAWYAVVISQLTSMSPIILSAFIAGILQ